MNGNTALIAVGALALLGVGYLVLNRPGAMPLSGGGLSPPVDQASQERTAWVNAFSQLVQTGGGIANTVLQQRNSTGKVPGSYPGAGSFSVQTGGIR